jgi:hypothetical protein
MRTALKYAAALTVSGALALAAATPSQARWHHGWHNGGAAAAGFAAGALIGAAAASANSGYYYAPGYYGYAYQPAPGYYAPGPQYYYGSGYNSDGNCTVSPGSGDYTPCYSGN